MIYTSHIPIITPWFFPIRQNMRFFTCSFGVSPMQLSFRLPLPCIYDGTLYRREGSHNRTMSMVFCVREDTQVLRSHPKCNVLLVKHPLIHSRTNKMVQ
jgi:hypothetical protein